MRRLALVLLAILVAPALLILALRWIDPPMTAVAMANRAQGVSIDRRWVPLNEIARELRFAVIASEDNHFCAHHGFDWRELRGQVDRALEGERPRGASTLTMQVAKNLFLWGDRSLLRKGIEAWLTPQIELLWPKRRILEVYLNIVEFGTGVFGAEAAAQRFFDKGADALTRAEAARLAVVLPAPSRRDPTSLGATLQSQADIVARRIDQLGNLLDCAR